MELRKIIEKAAMPVAAITLSLGITACGEADLRPAAVAAAGSSAEACAPTWNLEAINRGDSAKWFADGVQAIRDAQNAPTDQARAVATEAAHTWFDAAKRDTKISAGIFNYFGIANGLENMKGVTSDELVDPTNSACASSKAAELAAQFNLFLADPNTVITPGIAPANGVNSGADSNGNVVRAAHAGVYGTDEQRKALRVDFTKADGQACSLFIMERCGQIVTEEDCVPPNLMHGKTDDGEIPGNPNVPADGDHGTPDVPGNGPAGQTPNSDGYLSGETPPAVDSSSDSESSSSNSGPTPTTGTQSEAPPAPPVTGPVPPDPGSTPPPPPAP